MEEEFQAWLLAFGEWRSQFLRDMTPVITALSKAFRPYYLRTRYWGFFTKVGKDE